MEYQDRLTALAALREVQTFLRLLGDATNEREAHDLIVNSIEDVEDTLTSAIATLSKA